MPVRQIPKNYRNVTGVLASAKTDAPAQFESTLERDFYTLLEFTPEVAYYEVQPVSIFWQDGHRSRRYTPDVLVLYGDDVPPLRKIWLYEVKYRSELRERWAELRPKLRSGVSYARRNGMRFKIVTEIEIRTTYLANAKFLLPFRRRAIDADHATLLLEVMRALGQTTPVALIAAVFRDEWHRAALLPSLWGLIASFRVGVDLHAPITMDSPIWSRE
jgi:hypothetical protein